jgi:hypothetical protein
MAKKILINGIVGGVVIFVWGAVSHMLLPLGEAGIKAIPNEEPVLAALRENIKEPAVYLFPGSDPSGEATAEFMQKWERGPSGFLVCHPEGLPGMSVRLLGIELLTNIAAALIAAFLISRSLGSLTSFFSRFFFVFVIGFVPFFSVDASYWNWYGFPAAYSLASLADQVIGFGLAGLVMAKMMKPAAATPYTHKPL